MLVELKSVRREPVLVEYIFSSNEPSICASNEYRTSSEYRISSEYRTSNEYRTSVSKFKSPSDKIHAYHKANSSPR